MKNPGASQEITKYYFAGTSRIAMRKYTVPVSMSVEYFLSDHLGSTSITTDNAGTKISEMRYKPWGEVRYSWTATQSTTPAYTLPKYTFTGQYSYMDDPSTSGVSEGFGLMFYNARMYDPALGRFTSADSIVPGGVQGYDRYAYVNNNPVRYTDPTGHMCSDPEDTWSPMCDGADHQGESSQSGGGSSSGSSSGWGDGGSGSGSNQGCGICGLINDGLQELFGGHKYKAPPGFVCLPLPWINCTGAELQDYRARNQYPGQFPWAPPVETGGTYNVFPAKIGKIDLMDRVSQGSGAINVVIRGNTISNFAVKNHVFYPGYVDRTSHEVFGMTYVTTYGEGYNDGFEVGEYTVPGWVIDQANNVIGPYAFTALNVQMIAYTTWVETGQAWNGTQQP